MPVQPAFDFGKGLQLLQSGLLILTFIWALNERKRYRQADRFGKVVIDFVTTELDGLSNDVKQSIEEVRLKVGGGSVSVPDARIELLGAFQTHLYHVRTVVLSRIGCFPSAPWDGIANAFEYIEDTFSLSVEHFDPTSRHLEVLTSSIAKGTSTIISTLLRYEAELSGHIGTWWSKYKAWVDARSNDS